MTDDTFCGQFFNSDTFRGTSCEIIVVEFSQLLKEIGKRLYIAFDRALLEALWPKLSFFQISIKPCIQIDSPLIDRYLEISMNSYVCD